MSETIPDKTKEQIKKERNAERNRIYRATHKERINRTRNDKRHALKAITKVESVVETPVLKKAVKLPPQSITEPQEKTKKAYSGFIKTFYKRYTNKDLSDDNDIYKKINDIPYKALAISKEFKPFISANLKEILKKPYEVKTLYIILRGIRGFTEIERILYPYLQEYQAQYEANRSIIKAEAEDLDKIKFNIEDIRNNLNKLTDSKDKIVYGFAMIIKRRFADLQYMKVATDKTQLVNKENNWIYNGKIYINRTKNKDYMVLDMPEDFKELVKDIKSGYVLGREIPAATLASYSQRVFLKVYGKVYTANNIRHLYASSIVNKGATYAEKRDTARASGHTIAEQAKYAYTVV
jgi:hypothetical protein